MSKALNIEKSQKKDFKKYISAFLNNTALYQGHPKAFHIPLYPV